MASDLVDYDDFEAAVWLPMVMLATFPNLLKNEERWLAEGKRAKFGA